MVVQGLLPRVPMKHGACAKLEPFPGCTPREYRNGQIELVCWTMTARLPPMPIKVTRPGAAGISNPVASTLKNPLDLRGLCGALPSQARYTPDLLIIHATWCEKLLLFAFRGVPERHVRLVLIEVVRRAGGFSNAETYLLHSSRPISENAKSFLRPVRKRKFGE